MSEALPLSGAGEIRRALLNAFKLSGSLALTWTIGLAVRFVLPRHLGPELYGELNFADALAATFCVVLHLGIEVWVRKEIAVQPERASRYFGGVQLLRAAALLAILATVALVLRGTHHAPGLLVTALLFAVGQYFVTANATLSAMLHAVGQVDELSILSVASKIIWGGIIGFGIVFGHSLLPFVLALVVSESIECVVLFLLARRYVGLRLTLDLRETAAVLISAMPFFVSAAAQAAYTKLDVTVLAFSAPAVEVGYYSAASSIASIGMLLAPLVTWVLMPVLARAAAQSPDELDRVMRRSTELVMGLVFPCVLLLGLGAEVWVRLILGPAFAPSAFALMLVAGVLVLTYLGTLAATFLIVLDRGWPLTWIGLAGIAANLILNLLLIHPAMTYLHRPGAGGVGCAVALLASEVITTAALLWALQWRAFDARGTESLIKSLAICAMVIAFDHLIRELGPSRLLIDAALYVVLGVFTKVLRPRELAAIVRRRP